ncbi:MAG: D-2-hydroxyacid dehydrogenase [Thermoleophilaceae bacterium]|nr:D-2-hydroxyacid dehydrogenase [Thermoleophilaceae bacterium]
MKTVALPRAFADEYGVAIEAAGAGQVRLLPLRGEEGESDLGDVEIAVYAPYEGALSFAELADRMPSLRWIHSTGAGIDSFASRELVERGVIVTNSAGVYAPAMAEYAIAGMVAIARDLRRLIAQQEQGLWKHEPVSGAELYGKRVGIIGFGATGRYLAAVCKALGMEVWATKRTPMLTEGEPVDRLLPPDGLHELLGASDYVVVAASLNSTTRHLLGDAEFQALKPGAGLVNVARGGLVDQDALLAALDDGRVGGAVLDVVVPQPLPSESPLWAHPRVIVTSHISGGSPEGWARSMDLFRRNLPLYIDGDSGRMGNLVNLAEHL